MRAARRRDTDHGAQEFRIAGDRGSRQAAVTHQGGGAVEVGEDRLHQLGALHQAGAQLGPFLGIDDQRNMAHQPRAHRAGRVLVDAVEHTGVAQVPVGGGEAAIDLLRPHGRERLEERPPVRTHLALMVHHLVEIARQRTVVVRQQLRDAVVLGRRSALGLRHG